MLRKCANPACGCAFRKMSQGKLFLLEMDSLVSGSSRRENRRALAQRVEYYWLCDQCASVLTLSYTRELGMVAVPLVNVARKKPPAALTTEITEQRIRGTGQSA